MMRPTIQARVTEQIAGSGVDTSFIDQPRQLAPPAPATKRLYRLYLALLTPTGGEPQYIAKWENLSMEQCTQMIDTTIDSLSATWVMQGMTTK